MSKTKEELSLRERLALILIIIAIKIVSPTQYDHEISGDIINLKDELNMKKGKYES